MEHKVEKMNTKCLEHSVFFGISEKCYTKAINSSNNLRIFTFEGFGSFAEHLNDRHIVVQRALINFFTSA